MRMSSCNLVSQLIQVQIPIVALEEKLFILSFEHFNHPFQQQRIVIRAQHGLMILCSAVAVKPLRERGNIHETWPPRSVRSNIHRFNPETVSCFHFKACSSWRLFGPPPPTLMSSILGEAFMLGGGVWRWLFKSCTYLNPSPCWVPSSSAVFRPCLVWGGVGLLWKQQSWGSAAAFTLTSSSSLSSNQQDPEKPSCTFVTQHTKSHSLQQETTSFVQCCSKKVKEIRKRRQRSDKNGKNIHQAGKTQLQNKCFSFISNCMCMRLIVDICSGRSFLRATDVNLLSVVN